MDAERSQRWPHAPRLESADRPEAETQGKRHALCGLVCALVGVALLVALAVLATDSLLIVWGRPTLVGGAAVFFAGQSMRLAPSGSQWRGLACCSLAVAGVCLSLVQLPLVALVLSGG